MTVTAFDALDTARRREPFRQGGTTSGDTAAVVTATIPVGVALARLPLAGLRGIRREMRRTEDRFREGIQALGKRVGRIEKRRSDSRECMTKPKGPLEYRRKAIARHRAA